MYLNLVSGTMKHPPIDPQLEKVITKIAQKYTRGSSISWEDAAQNAIMKVYEALNAGKFQGGIEEFPCWATVVAKREIINFVKKESLRNHPSLDAPITGTDLSMGDTIADEFNLLDAVTHAELIFKVRQAIIDLDSRYSKRNYLKLWQLRVADHNQIQQASALGISQGEVSKRWKQLVELITIELGLVNVDGVKREQQNIKNNRKRSEDKW
ncbi:sigma-70 family RNA polymerase sigma factor [Anabaena catenula FACHB-362]|uniref:Sigma-70 family RNA polymerase sigma factor n=2 Tax=Anabaena TaxID=1163 RepID=A0ABR8IYA0_9NOST|nr:sigma-70 family RNA polymerase sigma factor [Anabaena catenula FACHB-362]